MRETWRKLEESKQQHSESMLERLENWIQLFPSPAQNQTHQKEVYNHNNMEKERERDGFEIEEAKLLIYWRGWFQQQQWNWMTLQQQGHKISVVAV